MREAGHWGKNGAAPVDDAYVFAGGHGPSRERARSMLLPLSVRVRVLLRIGCVKPRNADRSMNAS